jgi:predicted ester cyclase
MTTEEDKALIRRWFEERYNKRRVAVADELIAANHVNHSAPHGQASGLEGEKRYITTIRCAFPDLHVTIEDQGAEGDKVVTRVMAGGTYMGGMEDIPSTAIVGRHVNVPEILIHRVARGKVVEGWIVFDELGLWQQLGVIPSLGEAGE